MTMVFRRILLALCLTLFGASAFAQGTAPPYLPNGLIVPGSVYYAKAYGSCTWGTSAGNDVGPCINAAIAAAATSPVGGTVVIPAGAYNVATPIVQSTNSVRLLGQGLGIPRATGAGNYLATTRLIWTGSPAATMLTEYAGSNNELYNVDVEGIVFDCANLAAVCAHFTNVSYSNFAIGSSEPQIVGLWFDTAGTGSNPGPGNQYNQMWLYSRSTSPSNTYSPTGILLDQGSGSIYNTSFNKIFVASAWFAQGDGIVIAGTDNNDIFKLDTYGNPGNDSGRPIVFANTAYTMPNGNTVNGNAYDNKVYHHSGPAAAVLGFQAGSSFTAGSGNTGTAELNPVVLTTNGTTAAGNATLNFASTTGIGNQLSINCGGYSSGVMTDSRVNSFTGTTVVMWQGAQAAVATDTNCTFSYGITNSAVPGTYTITATGGATYNITAPAGGHSQTGISVSSGILTFTDMVIPITGTAVAGDTFTVVVPTPSVNTTFMMEDKANNVQDPLLEAGANYWLATSQNPIPTLYGGTGNMAFVSKLAGATGASGSFVFGLASPNGSNATGTGAVALGGLGNSATGTAATSLGGNANVAGGNYSLAFGGIGNTEDGTYSAGGGANGWARGRFNIECWGAGKHETNGDSQLCYESLRGAGSSSTAIRLTADGSAAGTANCINIPNNTAYGVVIDIEAFDETTVSKNSYWPEWAGQLTRGSAASTTAVTMNSTPTPITNGTLTGQAISVTADTTNGCLNVSYTPPTSNTDTWNVVARVQTIEAQ